MNDEAIASRRSRPPETRMRPDGGMTLVITNTLPRRYLFDTDNDLAYGFNWQHRH
jgi:hypothetical protein